MHLDDQIQWESLSEEQRRSEWYRKGSEEEQQGEVEIPRCKLG